MDKNQRQAFTLEAMAARDAYRPTDIRLREPPMGPHRHTCASLWVMLSHPPQYHPCNCDGKAD